MNRSRLAQLVLGICSYLLPYTLWAQHARTLIVPGTQAWFAEWYSPQIVKLVYQPHGYTTNELISNAVLKHPRPVTWSKKDSGWFVEGIHIRPLVSGGVELNRRIKLIGEATAFAGAGFEIDLKEGEKIYGGGERALPLNRRGYSFNLYNAPNYAYGDGAENLNYGVPFFISSDGYGIFFDNPSKGWVDIGKSQHDKMKVHFASGELNVFFIFGKSEQDILRQYHELTGFQPLPLRWAFGNLMSRFGYRSEAQVKEVYSKMKKENFGVDGVIFDLFWFGDSVQRTMGNLDWVNKEKWPNPTAMMQYFHKEKVKPILILEPFLVRGTKQYESSLPFQAVNVDGKPFLLEDFYFGKGGLIDIFRKDAQSWMLNFYSREKQRGVQGWWTDLGEPENHPAEVMHNLKDLGFNRLFKADEVHNIYGHYWNKMLFDFYRKHYPKERLFHLNRSGYAGSARYGIFPWTGDVGRDWSGLAAQTKVLLGMSMSGVPYVHADAGGFAMTNQKDGELYTRWVQMSVFTPIFRPHGSALEELTPDGTMSVESEPVFFDQAFQPMLKEAFSLRYKMLPYNYHLAYEHNQFGTPLMRPMHYAFAGSPELNDQYMWGDALLVAPVLKPSQTVQRLWLPKGKWYHFATQKLIDGSNEWAEIPASLNQIPYLLKEGGFFTTTSSLKNTDDYTGDHLTIWHLPSVKKSNFSLYEDDGRTYSSIATGAFCILKGEGIQQGDLYKVKFYQGGKRYVGMTTKREIVWKFPLEKAPRQVFLGANELKLGNSPGNGYYTWDSTSGVLEVKMLYNGQPQEIRWR